MKQLGIRTVVVSLAAVSAAFVGGIVIASHPAPTKPIVHLYKVTADVTQVAPDTASSGQAPTPTTNSTATPQPVPTTITTPAVPTNAPAPQTSQNSTVAPTTNIPPITVTAVSADMLPWTDPVATAPQGGLPGYTTTVSYQYCQYIYSDGSTKQTTARTKYATTNAGGSQSGEATLNSGADCVVSTAPAAN